MRSALDAADTLRLVKFGEVVRCVNRTTRDSTMGAQTRVVGLDHMDPESLELRRWDRLKDLPDGTSFTRTFKAGQVLFGKRRAYQRKVSVPDFDGICSGDILVLEASGPGMLQEFLPHVVQSDGFFAHALGTSAGSLSPRTKWQELAKYEFHLPSLDEQRRIVEALSTARAVTEMLRSVGDSAQSLVNALIEERLAAWRNNDQVPELAVEDLVVSPPRNGLSMRRGEHEGPFVTVALSAVRNGTLELEGNLKRTTFKSEEVAPFLLAGGEFLVVRGNGNRDLVGRACIVSEVVPGLFHHDKLIRIQWNEGLVSSRFALYLWNSRTLFRALNATARGSNGIYMVNSTGIRGHRLPVPGLAEQHRFVGEVGAALAVFEGASRSVDEARHLARTMREHMLRGSHVQ